jgi:alkylation response protein AidB-like acyl-CoA dehydrogenase
VIHDAEMPTMRSATLPATSRQYLAPHTVEWDQAKHFPRDVLRKAASLRMGGIHIHEDGGGSQLTRVDAARIFEQLATGCPSIAAYISTHDRIDSDRNVRIGTRGPHARTNIGC